MKKSLSDDTSYYSDFKHDALLFWKECLKNTSKSTKFSKILENSYLYQNSGAQDDEHDRLCVLLPLIKIEIENQMISKEMLGELENYYDVFNNGDLDNDLYECEYEEIKKDLYWCYEHRPTN